MLLLAMPSLLLTNVAVLGLAVLLGPAFKIRAKLELAILRISASRRISIIYGSPLLVSQFTPSSIVRSLQMFSGTLWIPKAPTSELWPRTCWTKYLVLDGYYRVDYSMIDVDFVQLF